VVAPAGPFNTALGVFGIQGPLWLLDATWVKPALILLSVWGAGSATALLLAAMKGIPRELYEAAEVDGAGALRQFWSITVPHLTPIIFFSSDLAQCSLVYGGGEAHLDPPARGAGAWLRNAHTGRCWFSMYWRTTVSEAPPQLPAKYEPDQK
jgi:hypothetical protein